MSIPANDVLLALEVIDELERARAKFPNQVLDRYRWLAVIGEEYGEACKAAVNGQPPHEYEAELTQCAAMVFRAILASRDDH